MNKNIIIIFILVLIIFLMSCTKQGCEFNNPSCNKTFECVNNQCQLKMGCTYNNPSCEENQDCIGNFCRLKEGCQFNNPSCENTSECVNNQCQLKMGCTYNNHSCEGNCVENKCIPLPNINDLLHTCPSLSEIEKYETDFIITSDIQFKEYACEKGKNPYYQEDRLDPKLTIYQALRIMDSLPFSKNLPWTDESLYDWLKNNIKGIHINKETDNSYCCNPDRVINLKAEVIGASRQLKWVDPQSGTGMEALPALLLHEARHVTHGHTCGTNDATLDEGGAWALQYYLYYWYGHYLPEKYLSDYEKEMAVSFAKELRNTRFCEKN